MKTCLIVDDSKLIRKVARQILESIGYKCGEAENGQAALDMCKSGFPDLVMLDWNMPVMNGLEYAMAVRKMPGGDRPKIVFCTVANSPAQIQEALDAGADEYIMKPFDVDIVRSKLDEVEYAQNANAGEPA